jgi:hypothetical protein
MNLREESAHMGEVVVILGAWGVSVIVVGFMVGSVARFVTAAVLARQAESYRKHTGEDGPPTAMIRSTATMAAIGVVLATVALGLVAELLGIRPPGAGPFTFATYFVAVMPASAAGAAIGSSMAVTKGAPGIAGPALEDEGAAA